MVSFLHTADLHLGMRVTRFEPAIANKIREARLVALDNFLKAATERRVDFVLIAGDLFDDQAIAGVTIRRAFEMLEAAAMPVFVLPGNHDPLLSGGIWDRLPWSQATDPARLYVLSREERLRVAPGVEFLPCPVLRRTSTRDPTAWISSAPAEKSAIRIGVAHGSLKVRDHLPIDDHLIERDAAARLNLDYLALGHWHSRQLFTDADGVCRTAYPGVHEPMRFQGATDFRSGWLPYSGQRQEFLDSGKGEVLHVRIGDRGQPPIVEPVEVGHFVWQEERCEVASNEDLSRVINDLATRPDSERRLLRLVLAGVLDASAMLRLEELRDMLGTRYLFGELDESQLHLRPTEEELRETAGKGILRSVMEALQAETKADDADQRIVAERALLLLYQIARRTAG